MAAETTLPTISYDTLLTSEGEEDFLGEGGFSSVYRCHHDAHGTVAVKILKVNGCTTIRAFDKEGQIHLKACSFPHILNVIGLSQREGFVGLVLEYMPYGNLAHLIGDNAINLPWKFRLRAMRETAAAMAYLHNLTEDKRVIHCDIKSENILLTSDLHVKVSDFGGASISNYTGVSVEPSVHSHSHKHDKKRIQYTLSHVAPELLDQIDIKRTTDMDIYSFAIVLYVVTCRKQPFAGHEEDVIINAVKRGQRPKAGLDDMKEHLEGQGNDDDLTVFNLFHHLMDKCWKPKPKERLKMSNVRDSLTSKLNQFLENQIAEDVLSLKREIGDRRLERPRNLITVFQKYRQRLTGNHSQVRHNQWSVSHEPQQQSQVSSRVQLPQVQTNPASVPYQMSTPIPLHKQTGVKSLEPSPIKVPEPSCRPGEMQPRNPLHTARTGAMSPRVAIIQPQQSPSAIQPHTTPNVFQEGQLSSIRTPLSPTSTGIKELEQSFADPYFREGNTVRMISDIAAMKNAQVGHGGWKDSLMGLLGVEGTVRKVEGNGDVTVSFSGWKSQRFNPSSLVKMPSDQNLHVGDFVMIELDKELVELYQEGHGGWVENMYKYFSQLGVIYRFVMDRDVLVAYKDGAHFRYNPDVLFKPTNVKDILSLSLPENPSIKIGDYVCIDLEEDVLKSMQGPRGGWNDAMTSQLGKVGKLIYVDYHGHAFIAYNSKISFAFNPVAISKLSKEEASKRFTETKNAAKRIVQAKAAIQIKNHRFSVGDRVGVRLPLEIVVELQRGHGGWSYQMLEVYGMQGVVQGFDEKENAQIMFDAGNKWSFNPAVLELIPKDGSASLPSYVPPFRIGDKVRVKLEELTNNKTADVNHVMQAFRMMNIADDKAEILMNTGTVLGIDDDLDVVVLYGEGKTHFIKAKALEKV